MSFGRGTIQIDNPQNYSENAWVTSSFGITQQRGKRRLTVTVPELVYEAFMYTDFAPLRVDEIVFDLEKVQAHMRSYNYNRAMDRLEQLGYRLVLIPNRAVAQRTAPYDTVQAKIDRPRSVHFSV